jgi:hypothetical protein
MHEPPVKPADEADKARIEEIEKVIGRKLSDGVKIARLRPKRDGDRDKT